MKNDLPSPRIRSGAEPGGLGIVVPPHFARRQSSHELVTEPQRFLGVLLTASVLIEVNCFRNLHGRDHDCPFSAPFRAFARQPNVNVMRCLDVPHSAATFRLRQQETAK